MSVGNFISCRRLGEGLARVRGSSGNLIRIRSTKGAGRKESVFATHMNRKSGIMLIRDRVRNGRGANAITLLGVLRCLKSDRSTSTGEVERRLAVITVPVVGTSNSRLSEHNGMVA